MIAVYWTPEAWLRLEDIETYIAADSPEAARETVDRILARTRQLETAPRSGRRVPEYQREDLREVLERPYRIIYRTGAKRVVVLTVMHYRRLLPCKAVVLKANEGLEAQISKDGIK